MSVYQLHPIVNHILLGEMSESECQAHHVVAAAMYLQQILDCGPEVIKRCLAQDLQEWRDGNWQDFRGVTREEWEASRENIPERVMEDRKTIALAELVRAIANSQEYSRVLGAIERALRLYHHLFVTRQWERAANLADALSPTLRSWGQQEAAYKLVRQSVETVTGESLPFAQFSLAQFLFDFGEYDNALTLCEQCITLFRVTDVQREAVVLELMGSIFAKKGEMDHAIELLECSLAIQQREHGHESWKAVCLHNLSVYYTERAGKGDLERAIVLLQEAEDINRRLPHQRRLAANFLQQGIILADSRKLDEAGKCFNESLQISKGSNYQEGVAEAARELGTHCRRYALLLHKADRHAEAKKLFDKAIDYYLCFYDISKRLKNYNKVATGVGLLGEVHETQGQLDRALECYKEALSLYRSYLPGHVAMAEQQVTRVQEKIKSISNSR